MTPFMDSCKTMEFLFLGVICYIGVLEFHFHFSIPHISRNISFHVAECYNSSPNLAFSYNQIGI